LICCFLLTLLAPPFAALCAVLQVSAAFLWSCPGGLVHLMPFLYVIVLTGILTDRTIRDEAKCSAKYGAVYEQYRAKVPYKVIPGIW
jgi:7-dehydrocholesterol reductase